MIALKFSGFGWDSATKWMSKGKKGWTYLVGHGTGEGAGEEGEDNHEGAHQESDGGAHIKEMPLGGKWSTLTCREKWSAVYTDKNGTVKGEAARMGLRCAASAPALKMRYGFDLPQPTVDLTFVVTLPSPTGRELSSILQRHMALLAVFPWASRNATAEAVVVTVSTMHASSACFCLL